MAEESYSEANARVIARKRFITHPDFAERIVSFFYQSPTAHNDYDVRTKFSEDAQYAASTAAMMSKYPKENPLLKTISTAKICEKYMEDRLKNVNLIDVKLSVISKIRNEIMRKMRPNYTTDVRSPYRYVRESQIVPTALVLLKERGRAIKTFHDALFEPILKDIEENANAEIGAGRS